MHDLRADRPERRDDVVVGFGGGGSPNWAAKLMRALGLTAEFGGVVRLYDLDHESARTNAELGRRIQAQDEAVESLDAALDGADFVVVRPMTHRPRHSNTTWASPRSTASTRRSAPGGPSGRFALSPSTGR